MKLKILCNLLHTQAGLEPAWAGMLCTITAPEHLDGRALIGTTRCGCYVRPNSVEHFRRERIRCGFESRPVLKFLSQQYIVVTHKEQPYSIPFGTPGILLLRDIVGAIEMRNLPVQCIPAGIR